MMLLNKVITYCQDRRWVDSVSIAQHFSRDLSAIEGLLDTLVCKNMLCKMTKGCGAGKCKGCAVGCGPVETVRYMWVG